MKITNITFEKPKIKNNVLAFANITLDNDLVIKRLRIIKNSKKTFVAFPNKTTASNKRYFLVHPINEAFRKYIEDEILKKFNEQ